VTDFLFDAEAAGASGRSGGSIGRVSGRTYKRTRPRGFAPWKPQQDSLELVQNVLQILDTYREHLPMTARQVFYVLVGTKGYPKTEKACDNLLEKLNRARRAGLIPMDAIRDDGATTQDAGGFGGIPDFWDAVYSTACRYDRDLSDGQPQAVEMWCEAAGMVPMLSRLARPYGVTVYSTGGFDSVTVKHGAALRMSRRSVHTVVLHLGDLDPSGWSIVDSAADDIVAFAAELAPELPRPHVIRVAVTEEQVQRYGLETAPQKTTDNRGERMDHTVQAEALSPDQLAHEVRAALNAVVDLNVLAAVQEIAEQERQEILADLAHLRPDASG
jgi:hypothetical protein